MKLQNLVAATPVGNFSRTTATAYTHVNVWQSPRAAAAFASVGTRTHAASGVHQRWIKDNGYGVTWHGSEAAALNAAASGYKWEGPAATLVGTFPVMSAPVKQGALADAADAADLEALRRKLSAADSRPAADALAALRKPRAKPADPQADAVAALRRLLTVANGCGWIRRPGDAIEQAEQALRALDAA